MNGSDINIIQNRMNNNQETLGKQFEFSNLENINSEFIISEYQAKLMSQAANLYDPQFYNRNRFNKFARYGMLDITNNHQGSREYLFFSKPDLHIFDVNNDNYSLDFSSIDEGTSSAFLLLFRTSFFFNFSSFFFSFSISRARFS